MQKIAQAEILTSVLIIALLITSVIIVWFSIKNYAISLSPAVSCIDLQAKSIITSSACYNQTSNMTQVKLTRNSQDFLINQINFILDNQEYSCTESCSNCEILIPDSSKTYEINSQSSRVLIFINNCELKTIQIKDC